MIALPRRYHRLRQKCVQATFDGLITDWVQAWKAQKDNGSQVLTAARPGG
jgi:hypothetical protein